MNANEREWIWKDEGYQVVGAVLEVSGRMVLSQPNIRVHSRPFAVDKPGGNP